MKVFRSALLLGTLAVAACGGSGGHAAVPVTPAAPALTAAQRATATITFKIPARTAPASASSSRAATTAKRTPAYISSAATQIYVSAENVATQTVTGTTQLASYCVAQSDGSQACSVPVGAPVGNVTFSISLLDADSDTLAFGSNSTPVAIVQGAANVAPFIILDPVPAAATFSVAVIPDGSTTGVPVTQVYTDAGGATITGSDPLLKPGGTGGTPITLTLVTIGSSTGTFSTSASCASPATTFANWTAASPLYYCPAGDTKLGEVFGVQLSNGVQSAFVTPRTQYASTSTSIWHSSISLNGSLITGVWGNDGDNVFAFGFCCGSSFPYDVVGEGSYSTSVSWPTVSYSTFDLFAPYRTPGAGYVMSTMVGQGGVGRFAFTPTAYLASEYEIPLSSSVLGWATAYPPSLPNQVYVAETDGIEFGNVDQLNWNGLSVTASISMLAHGFPSSIALGTPASAFVSFLANNSIGVLDTNLGTTNALSDSGTQLSLDPSYTTNVVAGNGAVAYAVASNGGSNPLEVYALTATAATKVATFSSAADLLAPAQTASHGGPQTNAYDAVVGNDGRLYIVVDNSGTYRVVAYDPYLNTVVNNVINVSALDQTKPMVISAGQSGTIIVGGELSSDTDIGVVQYP